MGLSHDDVSNTYSLYVLALASSGSFYLYRGVIVYNLNGSASPMPREGNALDAELRTENGAFRLPLDESKQVLNSSSSGIVATLILSANEIANILTFVSSSGRQTSPLILSLISGQQNISLLIQCLFQLIDD